MSQEFNMGRRLSLILYLVCMITVANAMDKIYCDHTTFREGGNFRILVDEEYTYAEAKARLLSMEDIPWIDPGKLCRSFDQYWVAILLVNEYHTTLPMHAEGYISSSWIDSTVNYGCGNLPCKDHRNIMALRHNLISHFYLPPGEHLFIAKISDFHLPKNFTPQISASIDFDSKILTLNASRIFLFSVFAGMVLLLSLISFFIFQRLKDKSFLYYGFYCLLLFYNSYRVLAEQIEIFHWDLVYVPWVFTKMFLAIAFFVCYVRFVQYFIEAKEKYPTFFKITNIYWVVALLSLIPEIFLLINGSYAMSYSYYFVSRTILGLIGVGFIFLLIRHTSDKYVFFILLGSSFLLIGELASSLTNNKYSSIIATVGAIIDMVVFTFGLAYKIYKYNQSQRVYLHDIIGKTQEISTLNIEKSRLNMNLLQTQMNPHFIFNSLNSINRYILVSDKDNASNYLSKFSKLIRSILDHSNQTQISLADELSALRHYMDLEKIRFSDKFDYKISLGESVIPERTFIPPLIIQPFAENAIIHGFSGKKTKSLLEIIIKKEVDTLIMEVKDNGIGRAAAKYNSSLDKDHALHKSKGQDITLDRIKNFVTTYEGTFEFEIRDLMDQNGNNCGTSVMLKINCSQLYEWE